jgi:nucleoside-diphosphate-sugar epimerase
MKQNDLIVVCGAGGFIGGALVSELRQRGFTRIRAVDRKPQTHWYQRFGDVDNRVLDLQYREACVEALQGADVCFNLAADMGGMGFIELNKALCMLSVLINTHLLEAARQVGVPRFFFASSACVYAGYKQQDANIPGLAEADAYPADPEDGYGWEKLFSERMCRHFREDFGIDCRIARFHNVYGPWGTYDGGREKAPAAICRKIIEAQRSATPTIEIWGDGEQTRSFMYIDDCIEGILRLMDSHVVDPINLGSDEMVSINQLVSIVEDIADVTVQRKYKLDAPKGVRGRSSDNQMIRRELGWAPGISLREGMAKTYEWIYGQMTGATAPVREFVHSSAAATR